MFSRLAVHSLRTCSRTVPHNSTRHIVTRSTQFTSFFSTTTETAEPPPPPPSSPLPDLPENVNVKQTKVFGMDETPFEYSTASWERVSVPVHSFTKDAPIVGEVELQGSIFGEIVSMPLIHEVVRWHRNCNRQGTSKVKGIHERSGTGRKPHPQKGTGRARQGTSYAPHMRGGGRVHGPTGYRDFSFKLNKKFLRKGVRCMLSAKYQEGNLIIVDKIGDITKTKQAAEIVKSFEDFKKVLVVDGLERDPVIMRAFSNLKNVDYVSHLGCTVFGLVKSKKVVISLEALAVLEDRLSKHPQFWPHKLGEYERLQSVVDASKA